MLSAALWGTVAASSLIIGALLGVARRWSDALVGSVLAFGGGALIASVSFELAEEAVDVGGPIATALGLAAGALTYFLADRALEGGSTRSRRSRRTRDAGHASRSARRGGAGTVLAMGAFLDGIPEQLVLGIGIAAGHGVGLALLVAVFVSNLPEGIGSAADMRADGAPRRRILSIWLAVTAACAAASVAGFALADLLTPEANAAVNGFAGGALLVMLVDSLFPEARSKAGRPAGLITVLGFALGAALSLLVA